MRYLWLSISVALVGCVSGCNADPEAKIAPLEARLADQDRVNQTQAGYIEDLRQLCQKTADENEKLRQTVEALKTNEQRCQSLATENELLKRQNAQLKSSLAALTEKGVPVVTSEPPRTPFEVGAGPQAYSTLARQIRDVLSLKTYLDQTAALKKLQPQVAGIPDAATRAAVQLQIDQTKEECIGAECEHLLSDMAATCSEILSRHPKLRGNYDLLVSTPNGVYSSRSTYEAAVAAYKSVIAHNANVVKLSRLDRALKDLLLELHQLQASRTDAKWKLDENDIQKKADSLHRDPRGDRIVTLPLPPAPKLQSTSPQSPPPIRTGTPLPR